MLRSTAVCFQLAMFVLSVVSYTLSQGVRFPHLDLGRGLQATVHKPPTRLSRLSDSVLITSVPRQRFHVHNGAAELEFYLLDTAQVYRNEAEAGQALRESGIPRTQIFITTKFSGLTDVETAIQDSLKNVSAMRFYAYLYRRLDIPPAGCKLRRSVPHPQSKVGQWRHSRFVEQVRVDPR